MYIKTHTGNVYKVEDKGKKVYIVGEMEAIRFDQVKIETDTLEELVDVWVIIDIENNISYKSSEEYSYSEVLDLCYGAHSRIYGMVCKMDRVSGLPKMYCICHDEYASGDLSFVEQHYFKAM